MTEPVPRPTKVVLAEALAELQAREARLAKLEEEIAECRAAVKALRRLVEPSQPGSSSLPSPARRQIASAVAEGDEREELVLSVIGENKACPSGLIVRETGLAVHIVKPVLARLRDQGKVQTVGRLAATRYWLTEHLDRYVAEHNGEMPSPGLAEAA